MCMRELMQMKCIAHSGRSSMRICHAVKRLLYQLKSESWFGRNFLRYFERRLRQGVARDNPIYHAKRQRFLRSPSIAREQQLLCFSHTHFVNVRKKLMSGYAKRYRRIAKYSVVARNNEVAWPCEHKTCRNALALDGSYRRLFNVAPALAE